MSKPGNSKGNDLKVRQTVMGDFFSKTDKSKKTTKPAEQKKTSGTEKRSSLKRKVTGAGMFSFSWTRGAQRDTEEYRNGYPGKKDHPDLDDNYRFYMNQIPSKPDGDYIDKIHVDWWGDYRRLEVHHGYIQWLFPIRDTGLNWHAQELQLHEIQKLQKSRKAMKRILTSYKMMLDFYGMKLENEEDGTIVRADNWRDRFRHLNKSFHNYLRITRILKSLGEFGFEHLKKTFVKFVLYEGMDEGTLSNLIDSCVKYWIGVLKDDDEREEMFDYYEKLLAEDEKRFPKRRNRSPSPPSSYFPTMKTDPETGRKGISKTSKDGKGMNKDKKSEKDSGDDENVNYENQFSDDDEDGTLYYAMTLIDEDTPDKTDDKTKKDKGKPRKDHEMSDSDGEGMDDQDESQEMVHWNQESKKTGHDDLAAGSESYDSITGNDIEESAKKETMAHIEQKEDDGGSTEEGKVKNKRCSDNSKNVAGNDISDKGNSTNSNGSSDEKKVEGETQSNKMVSEEDACANKNAENDNINEKGDNKSSVKVANTDGDAKETTNEGTDTSGTKPEEMDTNENSNQNARENIGVGTKEDSSEKVEEESTNGKLEENTKMDGTEEMETL